MSGGKKLFFNSSSSEAARDSVGAFVRAGTDGDLISSGDGDSDDIANTFEGLDVRSFLYGYDDGGDNWDRLQSTNGALDVNLTNALDVDLDGIYNVSTNADPDNVGVIAHDRAATPDDTDQTFRSTGGTGDTDDVVAANFHGLDVNSLLYAVDSGGTLDRLTASNTAGALDVHIAGGDVEIDDVSNTAVSNEQNDVPTTEEDLVTSALTDRRILCTQNLGDENVFLGATGVTAANGYCMAPGQGYEFKIGTGITLRAIAASGTQDIRNLQFS